MSKRRKHSLLNCGVHLDKVNLIKVASLFTVLHLAFKRSFHLYGDVITDGEGLQNLGLCSARRVFEQGGIFIVPHLLCFSGLIRRTAIFNRL
jgi:hypothetical protein